VDGTLVHSTNQQLKEDYREMKYTIHNPTKSVRVIHDGIEGSQRQYAFQPGQTRTGIELSENVARELVRRTRNDDEADLCLRPEEQSQHNETKSATQQQPTQQNDRSQQRHQKR
jgi:hypothetical protein